MKLWMMLCAQAHAGSLAADRLAIYHHAVETLSEEARLGVLTAWQNSFTVKVVGLTPAAGEASRDQLANRGFTAHLGSGSAPYIDGMLQAKMYTVTTRAGLPAPEQTHLEVALQGFTARDLHLEHELDGTTVKLSGVATSAPAAERLATLLHASPCFRAVESRQALEVEHPAVGVAFRLDATPALTAGLTDCMATSAIPSTTQVEDWMLAATALGLTVERTQPEGSGRSRLGTLRATGQAPTLLSWMETLEAPDRETVWLWDTDKQHLRVEVEMFSEAPLDNETTLEVNAARRAHRRAQRRAQRGVPSPQTLHQRATDAAVLAQQAEDYTLLANSHPLLLARGATTPEPPAFTAQTPEEGRSALDAQQASLQNATRELRIENTTGDIDLSLRVFSMFVEQHGGTVLPGQVVRDRREGLVRHLHVEVQVQGEQESLEALHETILGYVAQSNTAITLAETAVSEDGETALLPLTVDVWGVDPLPERSTPEGAAPPVTRAEMLAVRGRPTASTRDPFVDPPAFGEARTAAQAVPTCARQPLGAYTFLGRDGERGQFLLGAERCEVSVGARLGAQLEGIEAWFVLVSVDEDAAQFELRARDGGPAAIQATTTLERSP